MRDLNKEHSDTNERKYAYDFDYWHRDYMVRALSPFFSGTSALELGCYKGEFSKRILKHFNELTIVEGSSILSEHTRQTLQGHENQNYKIICSYFESVELNDKFDAIFLMHTLEHLSNPQEILRRMKTWLKPTGKIFIVVPNANAASRQIAVGMGLISENQAVTKGEYEHGHRKTYALDTLLTELKEAGLTPIQHGGILFKGLANFQMDKAFEQGIIDHKYFEGCYQLGMRYPDLCASIYAVCH